MIALAAQTWEALFVPGWADRAPAPAGAGPLTLPLGAARTDGPGRGVVVEVWRFDKRPVGLPPASNKGDCLAVLLSLPQPQDDTRVCRQAFANEPWLCDELRDRGFPALDAYIELLASTDPSIGSKVLVCADIFADRMPSMLYRRLLLTLEGVVLYPAADAGAPAEPVARTTVYHQRVFAPDPLRPATDVNARERVIRLDRTDRVRGRSNATIKVEPARMPDLRPLHGSIRATQASAGPMQEGSALAAQPAAPALLLCPRNEVYVPPAFRFEDVEVIGFRINLDHHPDADAFIAGLVGPLNFHLAGVADGIPDLRYRPATRTLLVELLRYPRMTLLEDNGGVSRDDRQAQHELLLRVLVGRVDDDTAQARDPAVYVPAIFVDNPWSRALGREAQGFDKRLAGFCIDGDLLQPDGCFRGGDKPVPLQKVNSVGLISRVGEPPGVPLLRIKYDLDDLDRPLDEIDPQLALGASALLGIVWRQPDFGGAEFRRSFAREAIATQRAGFRSIQVSPVGKPDLPRAWIAGRFEVERARFGRPAGVASLNFDKPATVPTTWPAAWRRLMEFLQRDDGRVDLPTGDWYRMKLSMRLTVDNDQF